MIREEGLREILDAGEKYPFATTHTVKKLVGEIMRQKGVIIAQISRIARLGEQIEELQKKIEEVNNGRAE